MERVLPASKARPLYGVQRTREMERSLASTLPAYTLMQRAGVAVARLALAVAPHARSVWVAAGPGNNGGDGLIAAAHLITAGRQVHVTLLAGCQLPGDARDALARAQAAGAQISNEISDDVADADLAIDALLGIGANRPPEGPLAHATRMLNTRSRSVLAIDVPSGLNADTGQPFGDPCVRAQHCLTLLTLKPGLFTGAGRDHAQTLWFDDLGLSEPTEGADAMLVGSDVAQPAQRSHVQHKGSFGDVAIIGGAPGMTGAALLAARAAHAAGAGRVHVSLLDAGAATHDPLHPELMFGAAWWRSPEAVLARAVVVCGVGGGQVVREALPRLLSAAGRLVLDADALNSVARDTALQTLLRARSSRGLPTILTPHPLEAARLMECETAQVQSDRLAAAKALADRFDCIVVLKGSGTVVAAPRTPPWINATGNAALASAGTGDVLAGWMAGTWSTKRSTGVLGAAMESACATVFRHGAAADRHHGSTLRAGALIEALHADG